MNWLVWDTWDDRRRVRDLESGARAARGDVHRRAAEGLATKTDLREGGARLKTDLREAEFALKADLRETEMGLEAHLREVEAGLKVKIEASKAELIKWMFGMIGLQTLIILGAVITLARIVAN
jgi:hypothetical protein